VILDTLIELLYLLIGAVLSILPTDPQPPDITGAVVAVSQVIGTNSIIGQFIPVGVLAACLLLIAAARAAAHVWRFAVWILTFLHIGGGKG